MIHMSTIRSEIDNSSLVPVLQNDPKLQLSILNLCKYNGLLTKIAKIIFFCENLVHIFFTN